MDHNNIHKIPVQVQIIPQWKEKGGKYEIKYYQPQLLTSSIMCTKYLCKFKLGRNVALGSWTQSKYQTHKYNDAKYGRRKQTNKFSVFYHSANPPTKGKRPDSWV